MASLSSHLTRLTRSAFDPASLFPEQTETAVLCRILDWSTTALGPIGRWPEALRSVVRATSASTFPTCLWCGSALTLIYNDAYRVVLGSKHPHGLGRPGPDVWAEIWESIAPLFERIRAGRPAFWFEDQPFQVERGGRLEDVWFTFSLSPIRDEDGVIVGVMNVVAETTERVLAQRRLEQAREQAEAANRAKADFLAVMSHELRTPLNAIAGHADLLALGVHGSMTQVQHDAVERIKRSGRHLLGLINDILNYAKIEAGRLELHLSDVPVNDALMRLEAIMDVQAVQRGITFTAVECPTLVARADSEKLQQILLNLCSNALTATEAGGAVHASCVAEDGYAKFMVRDTGVGIAAEKLEEIFEPFVQINRGLSSPKGGTGLGLAISRELARAMGGDITATSVLGEGSVFTVVVPLVMGVSVSDSSSLSGPSV